MTSREVTAWLLLFATRAAVCSILLMPLIVTSSTLFPFIVGKAIYARSVTEVAFGLWLVLLMVAPQERPKRSWIIIAIGLWLAASIVAAFAGVSPQRSIWSTYERMQGIVDLAHWAVFILVASSVFRTLIGWRWVLSINLAVSVVASLLGLAQNFNLFELGILGGSARIESTLGNATYVGAYTMVNILVALGLIAHSWGRTMPQPSVQASPGPSPRAARRRRRRSRQRARQTGDIDWLPYLRVFWISAIIMDAWALWLTETRGALIGLAGAAAAFAVIYSVWGRIDRLRMASYGVVGLLIAVLILFGLARTTPVFDPIIAISPTLDRISTIGPNDQSIKGRVTSISAGLQGYVEKPIMGWGPENYLIAWGRHFDEASGVEERFDQAHNKLIEELTTKGAIGLAAYLAIWGAMIWVFLKTVRRTDGYEQAFVILMGAALAGFFVQNLFLFDSPVTVLQFALLVSFFVSMETSDKTIEIHSDGPSERESVPAPPHRRIIERATQALSRPGASTAGAAVVIVLVAVSIYLFNLRPLMAASTVVRTTEPSITWEKRFEYFQRSIDEFPPLANYARLLLMSVVSNNLLGLTTEELHTAIELIEKEGQRGLNDEPESWRMHVALAKFYQTASLKDLSLLRRARSHVDLAYELAPRTIEVSAISEQQEQMEARAPAR